MGILLYRILNSKSNYTEYDLFNGVEWGNYRLGDIIRKKGQIWNNPNTDLKSFHEGDRNSAKNYLINVSKLYPESYASKYLKYVEFPKSFKIKDLDILKKIFVESTYGKPSEDSLVIHLRLGDALNDKYKDNYSYNIDHYHKLYEKIKNKVEIKRVDIITGLHKNEKTKESNDKLNEIKNIFSKTYPTEIIITKNPDKDLYYMCHSKYFARSGGGFSELVVDYLKQDKNNIVYDK